MRGPAGDHRADLDHGTDANGDFIDPLLTLTDAAGNRLDDDDASGIDAQINFEAPETALYLIRVKPATHEGQGSQGPYMLEVDCE